jgi:hypothetical protein
MMLPTSVGLSFYLVATPVGADAFLPHSEQILLDQVAQAMSQALRAHTSFAAVSFPGGAKSNRQAAMIIGHALKCDIVHVDENAAARPVPDLWLFDRIGRTALVLPMSPHSLRLELQATANGLSLPQIPDASVWRITATYLAGRPDQATWAAPEQLQLLVPAH